MADSEPEPNWLVKQNINCNPMIFCDFPAFGFIIVFTLSRVNLICYNEISQSL